MPQIIVTADRPTDDGNRPVMFRERVNVRDFESGHFQAQLVERLGGQWATPLPPRWRRLSLGSTPDP